jgi:hypothetical protein
MFVVPMRAESWNWNEVKSEELLVRASVPSPWVSGADRQEQSSNVMPLLPKLREHMFTSIVTYAYFASKQHAFLQ